MQPSLSQAPYMRCVGGGCDGVPIGPHNLAQKLHLNRVTLSLM